MFQKETSFWYTMYCYTNYIHELSFYIQSIFNFQLFEADLKYYLIMSLLY